MTDVPDVPDVPLHPSLRKPSAAYRRLLRLLGLLLFLIMAGTLAFMMATALSSRDPGSLMLLALSGLVMLPVVALLGGLMWYLDRWQARRLNAANRVLRESPPARRAPDPDRLGRPQRRAGGAASPERSGSG
jgi:hypothetical protein